VVHAIAHHCHLGAGALQLANPVVLVLWEHLSKVLIYTQLVRDPMSNVLGIAGQHGYPNTLRPESSNRLPAVGPNNIGESGGREDPLILHEVDDRLSACPPRCASISQ